MKWWSFLSKFRCHSCNGYYCTALCNDAISQRPSLPRLVCPFLVHLQQTVLGKGGKQGILLERTPALPFPMSSVAFTLDSQHVLGRSIIGVSHGIIRIVPGR